MNDLIKIETEYANIFVNGKGDKIRKKDLRIFDVTRVSSHKNFDVFKVHVRNGVFNISLDKNQYRIVPS